MQPRVRETRFDLSQVTGAFDQKRKTPYSYAASRLASEIFHEKNIRHLPVISDKSGKVKGLLSARVLMDYVAENLPGEVLNLPPDSTIVAKETEGG